MGTPRPRRRLKKGTGKNVRIGPKFRQPSTGEKYPKKKVNVRSPSGRKPTGEKLHPSRRGRLSNPRRRKGGIKKSSTGKKQRGPRGRGRR